MENIDWGCLINVEKKRENDQYYLSFKRIKMRYRDPNDLDYFNHPFNKYNRMELVDDVHLEKSISEISLASTFQGVDLGEVGGKGKKSAKKRPVEEGSDLFDFARTKR